MKIICASFAAPCRLKSATTGAVLPTHRALQPKNFAWPAKPAISQCNISEVERARGVTKNEDLHELGAMDCF